MHVRVATQEFLASRRRSDPRVRMDYAQLLEAFASWCETQGIALETVRPSHIDAFLEHMISMRKPKKPGRTTLSTHTLDKYITIIKTFFKWASEDDEFEEFVKPSLVRKIQPQRVEEQVREVFTKPQIEALFKACDAEPYDAIKQRDRAIIAVLLDTGVRAAELCSMRLEHVSLDPHDPHIRVFGKNSKWREIGLGERSRRELRKYTTRYRADADKSEPVFITRYGRQYNPGGLFKMVKKLCAHAGVEGCSVHSFRHCYASEFMKSSRDIYRLSRLLGHTSVHTTETYLKSFTQQDARRGAPSPLDESL